MGLHRVIPDARTEEEKHTIAIKYIDRFLPFIAPSLHFQFSELIRNDAIKLTTEEKTEATKTQEEMWRVMEDEFHYARQHLDMNQCLVLTETGRNAKEAGGHFKYIYRNMKSKDYIIGVLKYFEKKGNAGNFLIEEIFKELHFDESLADGIRNKMKVLGYLHCTKSGCFIANKGKELMVSHKLGELEDGWLKKAESTNIINEDENTEDIDQHLITRVQRTSLSGHVFISYSHNDENYLKRLLVHLRPQEKKKQVEIWVDTKIKAGDKWEATIADALNNASIAILLISADFLGSDFITDNELPPLLKKAENNGLKIVPVIVKPCSFSGDKNLSAFQAINDPKIPLSKMNDNDQEEVYVKIADLIRAFVSKP